jgi:hypothetical protein
MMTLMSRGGTQEAQKAQKKSGFFLVPFVLLVFLPGS